MLIRAHEQGGTGPHPGRLPAPCPWPVRFTQHEHMSKVALECPISTGSSARGKHALHKIGNMGQSDDTQE
eukprot:1159163-Pelagomonas_calceolata.AAC.11